MADIDSRTPLGTTPLIFEAIQRNPQGIQFLLENGADIYARDENGWTSLN